MTRNKCQHKDSTLLEFKNNPMEIFRVRFCHKCDLIFVSTEYINIVALEELANLIKERKHNLQEE